MLFRKLSPPVIDMGGLYAFEIATGIPAPSFIEQLVDAGSQDPDAPLTPDLVETLTDLLAHCFGGAGTSRKQAQKVLKRSPEMVASALRLFLEDPFPMDSGDASADGAPAAELPSVLDMRAAWLDHGGEPSVFDGLRLWEHSRVLRHREKRLRAALVDAAVAARVAQSKDDQFKRFVSEMVGGGRAKTPREWAEHIFKATGHLPMVTQEELSLMKGRA